MTRFNNNAVGSIRFTVAWEKDGISHKDHFLGRKFNPVNDIFPRGMREALEGKETGDSVTFTYEPRMCIPRHRDSLVKTHPMDRLRSKTVRGTPIIPLAGRFYPQGHIDGLLDVYPDTLTPFRMVDVDEEKFTADRNHPLAEIAVTITATIDDMEERNAGTYGSLTHWREAICDWGPGMQARLDGEPTEFFHDGFFHHETPLTNDFTPPSMDATARTVLDVACARFISPDMRVLDFSMGSDRPEGAYDAAVCICSVEYMDRPVDVIRYVSHSLHPGAPVVIAFTNRFDAARAISGWSEIHEFERMGLVMEYLHCCGLDHDAGTLSFRNDWRPQDDPMFMETKGISDSVYVVYGHKAK